MNPLRFVTRACYLVACAFLACATTAFASQPPTAPIIPAPAHATIGEGTLDLSHGLFFNSKTAND